MTLSAVLGSPKLAVLTLLPMLRPFNPLDFADSTLVLHMLWIIKPTAQCDGNWVGTTCDHGCLDLKKTEIVLDLMHIIAFGVLYVIN